MHQCYTWEVLDMKPIPKRMITQTIKLETYLSTSDDNVISYDTAVTLKKVKVDSEIKRVTTPTGIEIEGAATLFVDKVVSTPTMTSGLLCSGSRITEHEGTDEERIYTVKQPVPFYDNNKLHHWEVVLE